MFNKKQIKAIIDVIKDKRIVGRPALQHIFEQGGYLWATNGYIALELCEINSNDYRNKCVPLNKLVGWYGTHTNKDTTDLFEMLEENEYQEPNISDLVHGTYSEAKAPKFDINWLVIASKFLGVNKVELQENDVKKDLYYVKPLEKMYVIHEAMGIKVYFMGVNK